MGERLDIAIDVAHAVAYLHNYTGILPAFQSNAVSSYGRVLDHSVKGVFVIVRMCRYSHNP